MRRASLLTAAAGIAASLLVSGAAYVLFDTLLLFLLVPFVPVLFRSRSETPRERRCPRCGFQTRDPEVSYCPRDGTELEQPDR